MKNLTFSMLTILLVFAFLLTSMMIVKTKSFQDLKREQSENSNQEMVHHAFQEGMITIKLKEGVGDYSLLTGKINLGIPTLDGKLSRFEVSQLKKRFTFNPEKYCPGMPDLSRIYQINFPAKYNIWSVVRSFANDPYVEYAEPIPVYYTCEIPNDELYDQMYHLPLISADAAWDIHHGEDGPEVIIGIIDNAVDWRHIDLVDNVWENLGEDADGDGHVIEYDGSDWIFDPDDENGIDDDSNGKIDDFVGWDFINENGEQDNDPTPNLPGMDHGTHCIGIANGSTNNMSLIASIAWNVKFLSAKMDNDEGLADWAADPYEAIIYMAELGTDIITNSWFSSYSQANQEVIDYAQSLSCIIVAAATNFGDEELWYPASYPGVISVAATNHLDLKASFSNYGIGIDICAPGVSILSLVPNNQTDYMSGTSMATPMVAGLLALTKSYYPGWSNEMIINQVLGTADNIDSLQPDLTDKLGYGRINAYRALTDSNVTMQQELRLRLTNSMCTDDNGTGGFEPGEIIDMVFTMRNFAVGLDTTPVSFTLSTNSPYVSLINYETVLDVPSDDFITSDIPFQFQINNNIDSTILITFTISAASAIPIPLEDEWPVEVLINQSGIFVFDGDGVGLNNAYSGEYIRDFLTGNSPYQVYYTQTFPASLNGFDAVFLSYGNYGETLSEGSMITNEMTTIIADYLYNGGYLYEECGAFFGAIEYLGYSNLEELKNLFSLDTVINPLIENSINLLSGLPGSVAEGLAFTGSSQSPTYHIDIVLPDSNGIAMFEEEDYGIVAVQGEGYYGQKTICFSYAIQPLDDDTLGTRDELMTKIAEFFELIPVDLEEPSINYEKLIINNYPNPAHEISNIKYRISNSKYVILSVYDIQGKEISILVNETQSAGEYMVQFDVSNIPAGLYFIRLQAGSDVLTKKMIKIE